MFIIALDNSTCKTIDIYSVDVANTAIPYQCLLKVKKKINKNKRKCKEIQIWETNFRMKRNAFFKSFWPELNSRG